MAPLCEIRMVWISRVEVVGRGVGLGEHQGFEEGKQLAPALSIEPGVRVALPLRLSTVTQDDLIEVDAAPVVAVGRGRADSPEWLGDEQLLDLSVVLPLPEVGAEVVPLEVAEEV